MQDNKTRLCLHILAWSPVWYATAINSPQTSPSSVIFTPHKTLPLRQITPMCSQASLQLTEVSSVHCSSRLDTHHFHQRICDYLSLFIFQCLNITCLFKLLPATNQHRLSDCTLGNGALIQSVWTLQVSQIVRTRLKEFCFPLTLLHFDKQSDIYEHTWQERCSHAQVHGSFLKSLPCLQPTCTAFWSTMPINTFCLHFVAEVRCGCVGTI